MADPTPERIAAALALAEAADAWYGHESTEEQPGWCSESKAMFRAMTDYRATAPKPLRTRAEVDAEIALRCRNRAAGIEGMFHVIQGSTCSRDIDALIREPLAPDPEPNRVTDHDADQRPHPYGPSSVDSSTSSPSVEPAAGATFHTRVAESLGLYDGDNGSYIYADEERCLEEIAKNAREGELWREHVRVLDEASDGLEEPEACGCEQSDDLKDRLTECRRLLRAIHGFAKSITELSVEAP